MHRRNKAEQKCTPDRNKEREYEYAFIKTEDQFDRRVPDNFEAGEHLDHRLRHEQAESAASQRDQQVLRHQLPHEPEPACTNCEANGEFAPARTSAAKGSAEALNSAIGDARPGLQAFSKQTIPEVGQLVRDLREMARDYTAIFSLMTTLSPDNKIASSP